MGLLLRNCCAATSKPGLPLGNVFVYHILRQFLYKETILFRRAWNSVLYFTVYLTRKKLWDLSMF